MNGLRVRLTVARMMVAVAVVAVGLAGLAGLERRRAWFLSMAEKHKAAEKAIVDRFPKDGRCPMTFDSIAHEGLARKYRRAARRPWLPIAPDPPYYRVN